MSVSANLLPRRQGQVPVAHRQLQCPALRIPPPRLPAGGAGGHTQRQDLVPEAHHAAGSVKGQNSPYLPSPGSLKNNHLGGVNLTQSLS